MKQKLLYLLGLIGLISSSLTAQVTNFNTDAFGFELTSVEYNGGTSDVVTAWTQVAGFTQSTDHVYSGAYSLKMPYDYDNLVEPKLQTYRSNVNNEGNYTFTIPTGATQDILVSAWVYTEVSGASAPTNITVSPKNLTATLDISAVTPGEWTYVYTIVTATDAADVGVLGQWSTIKCTGFPSTGDGTTAVDAIVYLDDLNYEFYNGVKTYTFEEYQGVESADAVISGLIEPNTNGNTPSTGWWFGNDTNNFSFSDEQQASGDYSLKFDSEGADGTKTNYSASVGLSTSPVSSQVNLVEGNYDISIKVYIESNAPAKFQTNIANNNGYGSETPFTSITWFTDTNGDGTGAPLPSGQWHTLTQNKDIPESMDGKISYKITDADIAVKPSVIYFDDLTFTYSGTLTIESHQLEGVKIYPNPTLDLLNVSCPAGTNIEVYNVLGVKVKSELQVQENHSMNVSNLTSGVYILKMEFEGKVVTKKFQVK